ncbi:WhiB family transcriptional regulator [Rhodococcus koreensis]|uniref:WhiB family transcriptional regulator n=1 Tax=Rhodococcus koreensis TaxID=99653 RepID=UPI0036707565
MTDTRPRTRPARSTPPSPGPRSALPALDHRHERDGWTAHGACRNAESSTFFSPEGERGRDRTNREAHAKQICRGCLVLTQCRAYALSVAEPYGTWGGMSETDRRWHARRPQHPARPDGT